MDISTGEFFIAQGTTEYIDKLLQSFNPSEIILQRNKRRAFIEQYSDRYYLNVFDDWVFSDDFAQDILLRHFKTTSLKGFGVEHMPQAIIAAGAALHYLLETHHDKIDHISSLSRIDEGHHVWLDKFTVRNLELLQSPHPNAKTLLDVVDQTVSPMGSRLMRRWIALPLRHRQAVEERLEVVDQLVKQTELKERLRETIRQTGDLERLISKVALGKISPRELLQVARALLEVENCKQLCIESKNKGLIKLGDQLNPCLSIRNRIQKELSTDPPAIVSKGNIIGKGVSKELDALRSLARSGKDYLANIQKREIENTGISSLKVGYNNVFGYYLEVTNAHKIKYHLNGTANKHLQGQSAILQKN